MVYVVVIVVSIVLFSKWGNSWKPRPPKHIREAIRRNRWTP